MKKEKKIAYVTGGMGGIGTAICRKLYSQDYLVIAGCGPNRDFTSWLTAQRGDGYDFFHSVGNVSDWESTKAAFEHVRDTVGDVDILVNNAGITKDGLLMRMSEEDFDKLVDPNKMIKPSEK